MRQFEIHALVDDRVLWDALRYLESIRAVAITARPYGGNGAMPPTETTDKRQKRMPRLATAIAVMREHGQPITVRELADGMAASGYALKKGSVHQVAHDLLKRKLAKRQDKGVYVLTASGKEAAS